MPPKQNSARNDADANRAVALLDRYAEFPPLLFWVPPYHGKPAHRNSMGIDSDKNLYPEPILRPDECQGDLHLLKCAVLGTWLEW